jgi:hypothetical protein
VDLEQLLGRKTAQHENLLMEYRKLLEIMARVASGEIPPSSVTVSIDGNNMSWTAAIPLPDATQVDEPPVTEETKVD